MVSGVALFKNYVDYMFELKQKRGDLKYVKKILNILWGALCEKKITHAYKMVGDEQVTLQENERITNIKKYDSETYMLECEEVGNQFLSGFARIGPFITAHGRSMIANLALEHVKDVNNIYRVHTDSILTSEPLNLKDKSDCEMGDFGLEHGRKLVEVVNIMSVIEHD
jgi:hypothetical protein